MYIVYVDWIGEYIYLNGCLISIVFYVDCDILGCYMVEVLGDEIWIYVGFKF